MEGSQAVSPMGDNPGENISLPATPQRAPPYSTNHPPISLPLISSFGFFTEGQVLRFAGQAQSSLLSPLDIYSLHRQPARVSGKENLLPIQNAHLAPQQVGNHSFGHGAISPSPALLPGHVQPLAYSQVQPGYNSPTFARTQSCPLPLPLPQPFHTMTLPQSPSTIVISSPGPLVGQIPPSVNDESAPPPLPTPPAAPSDNPMTNGKKGRRKAAARMIAEPCNTTTKKCAPHAKPTGAGSKSGPRNRRAAGTSNDEIMKLGDGAQQAATLPKPQSCKASKEGMKKGSKKVNKAGKEVETVAVASKEEVDWSESEDEGGDAGGDSSTGPYDSDEVNTQLTEEDKLKIIKFITTPEHWARFKLNKRSVFIKIASHVIPGKNMKIIKNYWSLNAIPKYKAVREWEKHTGGGDGDDEDDDHKKMVFGYSKWVLKQFKESEIFTLIDAIARDDDDVERRRDYNSINPLSDNEDDHSPKRLKCSLGIEHSSSSESVVNHDHLLSEAVEVIKKKAQSSATIACENLELARKRDQCEEEECQEWQKVMDLEMCNKTLEVVMQMLAHEDESMRKMGKEMMDDLYRK
ncbi:hypothetical protein BDQ17DRAFT_1436317 [Cyathus striatus]|nr:hypothetical protein BDQ17DRAFT_1436317 [Cyathus striatus]